MGEQGKQKVGCSDTKVKMNAIDNELSKIVGLDALKLQLAKFLKGILLDERRRALGLTLGPRKLPQLAFLGNPGTGKSMVARMLGKLLHMLGILPLAKVTEVKAECLVGENEDDIRFPRTELLKRAAGGILLVGTSFECLPRHTYGDVRFKEIEEIISLMDSGEVVVIFAGHPQGTELLLSWCDGIRNRVSDNVFRFCDFSCAQFAEILRFKVCNADENSPFHGFKMHPECTVDAVAARIGASQFGVGLLRNNGHAVDQMLVKAKENLDSRIDVECADEDADSLVTFTTPDFAAAICMVELPYVY